MSQLITVTNDFHNSECRLRVPADGILSVGQVNRCRRVLCGNSECTCGGALSERGMQPDLADIEWMGDGRVRVVLAE